MLTRTGKNGSPRGSAGRSSSERDNMEEELKKIREQLNQVNKLNAEIKELRAKQEKFNDIERELQHLRLKYNEDQERMQNLRDNVNTYSDNQNNDMISNLLIGVHRMNLDIKIPKFIEDSKHPIEYLNEIENYFNVRKIDDSTRLLAIGNSLEGKSKYWFENNKLTIATFESFKEQFKKSFFSIPIQIKIKEKWQARQYREENG